MYLYNVIGSYTFVTTPSNSPWFSQPISFPNSCPHFIVINSSHNSSNSWSICTWVWGPSTDLFLNENDSSSLGSYLIANRLSSRGGASWVSFLILTGILSSLILCKWQQWQWVGVCNDHAVSRSHSWVLHILHRCLHFPPTLQWYCMSLG